jgi:hypothetical protein
MHLSIMTSWAPFEGAWLVRDGQHSCCQYALSAVSPARRVLLMIPNSPSTRQQVLHHHSRQVKEHSHSPILGLWRHSWLATRTP